MSVYKTVLLRKNIWLSKNIPNGNVRYFHHSLRRKTAFNCALRWSLFTRNSYQRRYLARQNTTMNLIATLLFIYGKFYSWLDVSASRFIHPRVKNKSPSINSIVQQTFSPIHDFFFGIFYTSLQSMRLPGE